MLPDCQQLRQRQVLLPLANRLQQHLGLPLEAAAAPVGDAHDCDLLVGGVEEGSAARGFAGLVEEEASDDGFVGAEVAAVRLLYCHILAAVDPEPRGTLFILIIHKIM